MRRLKVLLIIMGSGIALAIGAAFSQPLSRGDAKKGREIYLQKCAVCHGQEGKGDGPAEFVLFPRPRDLTGGRFKLRSTPTLPTDDDLFRIITRGIPGTAMPSWAMLQESERRDLVAYVKSLSPLFAQRPTARPVRIPKAPKVTPALLKVGKEFYAEAECLKCHGAAGKGDGEAAGELKDDWGNPIVPYDFTIPGRMKAGNTVRDVYRTLLTGIGGTPMPSYADSLSEEQIWGLAYYVLSLAQQPAAKPLPERRTLTVRRVASDLPVEPDASLWRKAALQPVPLRTLWLRSQTIDRVRVAAVHNGREIGFLLEWDDPIGNQTILSTEEFRDAAAIQFPLEAVASGAGHPEPSHAMGDAHGPVNIWQWKADWQLHRFPYRDGDTSIDASKMNVPAWPWGNSMFRSPGSAVENLNAVGVGTLTSQPPEAQGVRGEGRWADGKWRVVIVRALKTENSRDTQFDPGHPTAVAFAVWDGVQADRDGRKAVSVWQQLRIE